jgi:tetratricopeptide (TPR) repeat protein
MKKLIIALLVLAAVGANAQSEKYVKAMEDKVRALDTVRTMQGWQNLANSFERIGDAEKTQWLPFYYAALSHAMSGYMTTNGQPGAGDITQLDMLADKAETLVNKAEALEKENSEIFCVKKMIATLKMSADPMNRWQTYGPKAAESLAKARTLDASNPRVYMLDGQDKFFTPEQFGGNKAEAKKLFEQSLKMYESFKPKSSIHPRWGMNQVKYFLAQVK